MVDTLEAAIWCLLSTDNYSSAVLKAANSGGDTDTVAAVAGGLAALGLQGDPDQLAGIVGAVGVYRGIMQQ